MDTLVLLSNLKSALKQNQLMCETLEEKLTKRLAETEESHQEEWREEGFRRELLEQVGKFRRGLCLKCERRGKRSQQEDTEKKELQEMLLRKEKIWNCEEAERKKENPVSHIAKHPASCTLTQFFFLLLWTVFRRLQTTGSQIKMFWFCLCRPGFERKKLLFLELAVKKQNKTPLLTYPSTPPPPVFSLL